MWQYTFSGSGDPSGFGRPSGSGAGAGRGRFYPKCGSGSGQVLFSGFGGGPADAPPGPEPLTRPVAILTLEPDPAANATKEAAGGTDGGSVAAKATPRTQTVGSPTRGQAATGPPALTQVAGGGSATASSSSLSPLATPSVRLAVYQGAQGPSLGEGQLLR